MNSAIILAGGEGKRMQSDMPKVLCEVLGRPMLDYVVDACKGTVGSICVIAGYKGEMIKEHLGDAFEIKIQHDRLGTAHAVMMATDFIEEHSGGNILVLCGDAPLMDAKTIQDALVAHEQNGCAVTVITAHLDDPTGYGRIHIEHGSVKAIIEHKDATEHERQITEVNSGAYWFNAKSLLLLLPMIENDNAAGEYYLTDTVSAALSVGMKVGSFMADSPDVVMGANDHAQLLLLEERMRIAELRA